MIYGVMLLYLCIGGIDLKVLIVDDEEFERNTLKSLLLEMQEDFTIIEAADGSEGLDKYKQYHPDIVFADIMIQGGIGGDWLIEKLLKDCGNANIIVCSGLPEQKLLKFVLMGAKKVLQKPVKYKELYKCIDDVKEMMSV